MPCLENGSLLPRSYCSCIPPQKCTLKGKWNKNLHRIIHLIITAIFSAWKIPEISGTRMNNKGIRYNCILKPSKNLCKCFLLLHWLSVGTEVWDIVLAAWLSHMVFFLHPVWWAWELRYTWKLKLENTESVNCCCSLPTKFCPGAIWLLKWKETLTTRRAVRVSIVVSDVFAIK